MISLTRLAIVAAILSAAGDDQSNAPARSGGIAGGIIAAHTEKPSFSKDAAVQQAAKGLGLMKFDPKAVTVEEVRFGNESLPFLRKQLFGKATYRITFSGLNLATATARPELDNPHITALVVFLAPESGQILKVTSVWPKGIPRIAEFPSCLEEERQMGAARFSAVPKEAPRTSLAAAIVNTTPWSNDVKQIHAYFVEHTSEQHERRLVWIIHLRGHGPIPFSGGGGPEPAIPVDARNHLRNFVDATTGEWLFADTIPQPAGPVESRY